MTELLPWSKVSLGKTKRSKTIKAVLCAFSCRRTFFSLSLVNLSKSAPPIKGSVASDDQITPLSVPYLAVISGCNVYASRQECICQWCLHWVRRHSCLRDFRRFGDFLCQKTYGPPIMSLGIDLSNSSVWDMCARILGAFPDLNDLVLTGIARAKRYHSSEVRSMLSKVNSTSLVITETRLVDGFVFPSTSASTKNKYHLTVSWNAFDRISWTYRELESSEECQRVIADRGNSK